jgi:8-oxo-dGTP pyrophosphatase MutT (NUDIX family)
VSLPGGKLEDQDVSAVAAALRELHEETGLQLKQHDSLGYLNPIESLHGLSVIPCVFWSDTILQGSPQEQEIADVFTIPLMEFVEQTPRFELSRRRLPECWMPRWRYHNADIWGLTALIVNDFFETVFNARFQEAPPSKP